MDQNYTINQLLFSTVRVEAYLKDESSLGTGFVVSYKDLSNQEYLFLVTNKHVIKGSSVGKLFFTSADDSNSPVIGKKEDLYLQNFEEAWFHHPKNIDISIMPFVPVIEMFVRQGKHIYYRSIPLTMIPTTEQENSLSALEEIVFVGYPSGIYDKANLLPVLRRGITATPVCIDYENNPTFLVDASVFPGSSGSPIIICNEGSYRTPKGITIGSRVMFLGVLSQVIVREQRGKLEMIEIPTAEVPFVKTQQVLNLGVVIKARCIVETIEAFLQKVKQNTKSNAEEKGARM